MTNEPDPTSPGSLPAASLDWTSAPEDLSAPPEPPFLSHRGLVDFDPWAQPQRSVLATWGLKGLAETLEVIALALIMFLSVRVVAHNYIVDGASMVPTFQSSELVIVNRLAYREIDLSWLPGGGTFRPFGKPSPGDVVVFLYQEQPRERDFIKRVIAVPGQSVEVRDGHVYVDGHPLQEPYINAPPNYAMPVTVVPEGAVFVLGDNRNNSFDSHLFGVVPQSRLIGRAELRYWPLSRFWRVDHHLGTPIS
ncbi:MAG: signal peptidase I [Dehalococcoidia bacterium]|nr:MAG: signal peptidase I [Dehalococcoidia bacterium]